jgi:hypothetical protein
MRRLIARDQRRGRRPHDRYEATASCARARALIGSRVLMKAIVIVLALGLLDESGRDGQRRAGGPHVGLLEGAVG